MALIMTINPKRLILRQPRGMAISICTTISYLRSPHRVLARMISAENIVSGTVLRIILVTRTILNSMSLLMIKMVILGTRRRIMRTLKVSSPIPVNNKCTFTRTQLTRTLRRPTQKTLITNTVIISIIFTLNNARRLTLMNISTRTVIMKRHNNRHNSILITSIRLTTNSVNRLNYNFRNINYVITTRNNIRRPTIISSINRTNNLTINDTIKVRKVLKLRILSGTSLTLGTTLVRNSSDLNINRRRIIRGLRNLIRTVLLTIQPITSSGTTLNNHKGLIGNGPILSLNRLNGTRLNMLSGNISHHTHRRTLTTILMGNLKHVRIVRHSVKSGTNFVTNNGRLIVRNSALKIGLTDAIKRSTTPDSKSTSAISTRTLTRISVSQMLIMRVTYKVKKRTALDYRRVIPKRFTLTIHTNLALGLMDNNNTTGRGTIKRLRKINRRSSFL